MRIDRLASSSFAVALAMPLVASAADGALEISQTCAIAGCFSGDAPGFPVTIDRNQPGSYRLTSSLFNGDEDTATIQVADDHVTLDLNGFSVNGSASCMNAGASLLCGPSGAGVGIATLPDQARSGIVVRNGVVRGMSNDAIRLGRESWVDGVLAVGNVGAGIVVGDWSLITRSQMERNMGGGLTAEVAALVEANTVIDGRDNGIVVRTGSLVSGNAIRGNGGTGLSSITTSSGGTLVIDNAITDNGNGASLHAADGYAQNVFDGNAADLPTDQVSGGVQLGTSANLCAATLCP